MYANVLAGSLLSGLVITAPLGAQQIAANVFVRGGPVAGHVVVENGYSTYRHPDARRVVIVERRQPRVIVVAPKAIVVERAQAHRHREYWVRRGYRPVTLYYANGRYYDRWVGGRGVREIVVYERQGRYVDPCDDHREFGRDYNRHYDRDHDRDYDRD